jgi:CRP-like cAMP-binding protein
MTELIEFIKNYVELDSETEQAVKNHFKTEIFEKNEFLVKTGKICTNVYFIKSGLVRRFYENDDREVTVWIYHENHWITSLASYFEQKPAIENFQTCERTVVYSLSYSNEQRLFELPLFLKFHLNFLRLNFGRLDEFHQKYELMNAHEKYTYLLTYFPEIVKRAKLKHIASLMNISQETLSRIRAAIN